MMLHNRNKHYDPSVTREQTHEWRWLSSILPTERRR
jgi:hypothetical protein